MLRIRIRDLVLFDTWIRILDHQPMGISESLVSNNFLGKKILKFLVNWFKFLLNLLKS